jgi:threonyl-tRNA synthetase
MIRLTFPDNSSREFAPGITGREVAEGISKSLVKKAVAMALDGELADLANPIARDAKIEIVTRDDPRAQPHPARCGACDGRGGAGRT